MGIIVRVTAAAVMIVTATTASAGQKASPADVARAMSGTWTINLALSTAFGPGRSGPGRSRGPAYAISGAGLQRGGRGGGGGGDTPTTGADLTPEELAERAAMRQIQQLPARITVAATPETFAITGEHSTETCAANGKTDKIQVGDVPVGVKCRWDKDKLRQEFSTTRSKLIRVWGVDEAGHLVLKVKLEGIGQNTPEATAVFDRVDR
jgi:hypothetical protein